jgi:hypothetical protein
MPTYSFNNDQAFSYNNQFRFVPLGLKPNDLSQAVLGALDRKLKREIAEPVEGIWGTLGWANDKPLSLTGSMNYSATGNTTSVAATSEVVQDVKAFMGFGKNEKPVIERFINLSDVDFKYNRAKKLNLKNLPNLQLTLFLQPDEGAVVFYQHSKKGKHEDESASIEYILPNATKNHTTNRDRLDYIFPIVPPKQLALDDNTEQVLFTDQERDIDFIVKILTFKREIKHPTDLMKSVTATINEKITQDHQADIREAAIESVLDQDVIYAPFNFLGKRKYKLLKYDPAKHDFIDQTDTMTIDASQKTLLLNHGTFSSTQGTYGELYGQANCVLSELITSGKFQQIIAFDHPTVSHDVSENVDWLYNKLAGLQFELPVTILGFSRGALVSKWLSSDKKNKNFKVDHILTFSGAYGVGYLTRARQLAKGLSMLKYVIPPPAGVYVAALAQFSVKYIAGLPGLDAMAPRGKRLNKVMKSNHLNPETTLQTVAADWKPRLAPPGRRPVSFILDASLKLILGWKHDWVVGFKNQQLAHKSSTAPIHIVSMHTRNFEEAYHGLPTHQMVIDNL